MTMLNVKKLANVFLPDATPSSVVPFTAMSSISRFKRKHGGLWVGGTILVSESGVSFIPNSLNRVFHDALHTIDVPAGDIREVRHEFGWFTGIVAVKHAKGEFRFRCYGARRLAAEMSEWFNPA